MKSIVPNWNVPPHIQAFTTTREGGVSLPPFDSFNLGDQTYGGRPRPPKNASEAFTEVLRNFKRQALHAVMLRLAHPITGEMMEWYAPLPDDFVELLHALKADYLEHKDELDY